MKGKQIGMISVMPKEKLNAASIVEELLGQMKCAVKAGNYPRYENLSDQLSVFSRAYVTPTIKSDWAKYGLTPAETIVAELLYAKLGENVRRTCLMDALYFSRPDEEPDIKIIDIFVFKIRKKIINSPFRIVNVWGQGYSMVEANSPRQNDRALSHKTAA